MSFALDSSDKKKLADSQRAKELGKASSSSEESVKTGGGSRERLTAGGSRDDVSKTSVTKGMLLPRHVFVDEKEMGLL